MDLVAIAVYGCAAGMIVFMVLLWLSDTWERRSIAITGLLFMGIIGLVTALMSIRELLVRILEQLAS